MMGMAEALFMPGACMPESVSEVGQTGQAERMVFADGRMMGARMLRLHTSLSASRVCVRVLAMRASP